MATELQFNLEGMSCGKCVAHVREAVEELAGVEKAEVSLEQKSVKVSTNGQVSADQVKAAIQEAGYEVV